jgi:hypothetical protein
MKKEFNSLYPYAGKACLIKLILFNFIQKKTETYSIDNIYSL